MFVLYICPGLFQLLVRFVTIRHEFLLKIFSDIAVTINLFEMDQSRIPDEGPRRPSVLFAPVLSPLSDTPPHENLLAKTQTLVRLRNHSISSVRHKNCSQLNMFTIRLMVLMVFIGLIIFCYKYYVYLLKKEVN